MDSTLNTFISLLRGINVGGHKKVLMADLKALYQSLNFSDVTTYIQSGNVIFNSDVSDQFKLKSEIEQTIEQQYGFAVPVELRTGAELEKIRNALPFENIDVKKDGGKAMIIFLSSQPTEENIAKLSPFVNSSEQLCVGEQCLYLYCGNGFGNSKLTNKLLENKLQVSTTSRNLKTLIKLCDLARANHK